MELGEAAALPADFAQTMLRDSLPYFGRKIRGYDTADALLTGPETRTSSPVRMTRGEDLFGLGCSASFRAAKAPDTPEASCPPPWTVSGQRSGLWKSFCQSEE